jgi:hypothetical protein
LSSCTEGHVVDAALPKRLVVVIRENKRADDHDVHTPSFQLAIASFSAAEPVASSRLIT